METKNSNNHLEEIVEHLKEIKDLLNKNYEVSNFVASAYSPSTGLRSFFNKDNPYLIMASMVLGAVIIGGALIFGQVKDDSGSAANQNNQAANVGQGSIATENLNEVTKTDHIRGNFDSPVKIVEFSDFDCPFCQNFHVTMNQIMEEFDGQVAWVYRHFPLESIHPLAKQKAVASECVNELGGNDKFWMFADKIFETTDDGTPAQLAQIVAGLGINRSEFEACLQSSKFDSFIGDQSLNARSSGALGTPYTIVVAPNGKKFVINGAQQVDSVRTTIQQALNEK